MRSMLPDSIAGISIAQSAWTSSHRGSVFTVVVIEDPSPAAFFRHRRTMTLDSS